MNKKEQIEYFDKFTSKMKDVLLSKSNDYSIEEDVLSNFKYAGNICGLKPDQNCLSLIATKVARLGVLLKSEKEPSNESIKDSVLDLANYTILLGMILDSQIKNYPELNTISIEKQMDDILDIVLNKSHVKN